MVIPAASAKPIVEIGLRLISKLSPHVDKFAGAGAEVVGEAANLAASAADNGSAASVFNGRQFLTNLGILSDLSEFQTHLPSLNGKVSDAQKGLLGQIINSLRTGTGEISAEQTRDLFRTVTDVTLGSETTSVNGNGKIEPEDHVEGANGNVDEANGRGRADKKAEKDKAEGTEGKEPNTDTKTEDDKLFDPIKKILRRELLNKSSWIGFAAEIAKQSGFGSIEDNVEGFIDEYLLTDKFKTALKNSITGEEVDTKGFNKLQEKAFKASSWALWTIDKMPAWSIQYFPLAASVIKFTMPIWSHISFLRKPLGTLYPVIDEVANFLGKFQDETNAIKDAINKMRPKEAPTYASRSNVSEEELD